MTSLEKAQLARTQADTDLKRQELARRDGRLVDLEAVIETLGPVLGCMREKILASENLTADEQDALLTDLRACLESARQIAAQKGNGSGRRGGQVGASYPLRT